MARRGYNDQLALSGDHRRDSHSTAMQPRRGFTSPFDMMDRMMADFDRRTSELMSGFGMPSMLSHSMLGDGMGSFASAMDMRGLPQGSYSSSVMVMSSSTGPDGKQHVEKYAASQVGNSATRSREVQEAYSNSRSGVDKMALERHVGDRGRKVVHERNIHTGEEVSHNLYKGISEAEAEQFDRDFQAVRPSLPQHVDLSRHARAIQQGYQQDRAQGRRVIADRQDAPAGSGRRGSGGMPQAGQLALGMGGWSEEPRQQEGRGRHVRQPVVEDDQRSVYSHSSTGTQAVLSRAMGQSGGARQVVAESTHDRPDGNGAGSGRRVYMQQQQQPRTHGNTSGYRNVRID